MKINISSWLISQVQLYPLNLIAAQVISGGYRYFLQVSLYAVIANSQCGNIQIVWSFTGEPDAIGLKISSTTLAYLYRLDNQSTYFYSVSNYVIPLDYTWGQVALIECITISGAN